MIFGEKDMFMEIVMTAADWIKTTYMIIAALGVIGTFLGLFLRAGKVLKSIEHLSSGQSEIKESLKEVHHKLDNHGNRLTAIETTLRLADWFTPYHEKAHHE